MYFCFCINNTFFFLIEAEKPIVMVLVNALPISKRIMNITINYLNDNKFKTNLFEISHDDCKYAKNIVGY